MKLNYVLQTRFDKLTKADIEKSFEELVKEKPKNFHYDIRLEKQNVNELSTSYDSYSLFPTNDLTKISSGHLFLKEENSTSWMQTADEPEMVAQVNKRKNGYIKIFTLEKALYHKSADNYEFYGEILNGQFIAKKDNEDYVTLEKLELDETALSVEKLNKELADIVKADIKLNRYSLEKAIETFPQLEKFL